MADDIDISAATLGSIRSSLGRGRTEVEETAGSAPGGIDAGDVSTVLNAMVNKAVDQAAALSEVLSVVGEQVEEAGADFWAQDDRAGQAIGGGTPG